MDDRDERIVGEAADFIAGFEGLLLCAYPDPASPLGRAIGQKGVNAIGRGAQIPVQHAHLKGDPWTVGYGATNGGSIRFGTRWTEQQARDALVSECTRRWASIKKLVTAPLAIPQAVALISFHYNLGEEALASSTLRRKLNVGDYSGAAAEFDKWVNAGGKRMEGLAKRRACERALFESALLKSAAATVASELGRILSGDKQG